MSWKSGNCNRLLSAVKGIYGFFCLLWSAVKVKFDPKNELKYRKGCSSKLVDLVATEIKIVGELSPEAQLLIGNHTSMLDIALLEKVVPEKLIWVAKKEIGDYPIFGNLVTKTGMILVDRKDKKSTVKVLKGVEKAIKGGFKVVIFPEGTRNKGDYRKLLPFKKGVKIIPERLKLKVQPFLILGLPERVRDRCIRPGPIELHFLPVIDPSSDSDWYEKVRAQLQQKLDSYYSNSSRG
ncbi:MAG: lysophospholipid acyltransferase family protein [Campylobacterales bacterium]